MSATRKKKTQLSEITCTETIQTLGTAIKGLKETGNEIIGGQQQNFRGRPMGDAR